MSHPENRSGRPRPGRFALVLGAAIVLVFLFVLVWIVLPH